MSIAVKATSSVHKIAILKWLTFYRYRVFDSYFDASPSAREESYKDFPYVELERDKAGGGRGGGIHTTNLPLERFIQRIRDGNSN